jgi:RNA polymerase sigma factor (sigma-70 family)
MTLSEEPRLLVANRILESVARQLYKAFKGRVELDELRSLGGPAVQDVLCRWDGRGRFEAFATQRIRWAMLRQVRRQALRDQRAGFRHDTAVLSAGEDAANRLPDDAATPEQATTDSGGRPSLKELLRQAAVRYTVELSACEVDELPDTSHDVEHDTLRIQARRAAERLPEPFASAVHRYYYRGETMDEMAEGMGVSKSTISERLARAMDRLREELCPVVGAEVVPIR